MERVDPLLMKAQQYLRSAAVLFEMEDYDGTVSRAYFAMFFAVQATLLGESGTLPSRLTIRTAFTQRFVDTGRLPERAAEALQRAADLQEVADYAQDFAINEEVAERTLQDAEAFVNSLARLVVQYA